MNETVKEIYAALNRNDIDAVFKHFSEEIAHIEFEGLPFGGSYRGSAVVRAHFEKARATWAEGSCTPERFQVVGNRVIAFVHVRVRLKDKIDWNEGYVADVFTFKGDKVVEMRTFVENAQAVEFAHGV
jgi:ketosteroid isomerase-like protein